MTSNELLMEGVELMFVGVGAVFLFLILLVGCTNLMSWLVSRFFPEQAPIAAAPVRKAPASEPVVDPEMLAVITAAIRQHRSRRAA